MKNAVPKFREWHKKATRFGLGLQELVNDIPEHDHDRFHKLVS